MQGTLLWRWHIHLPATILKLVYKLKGVENTCLVTDALAYAAYEGNEPIDPRYIIEDGRMQDGGSFCVGR